MPIFAITEIETQFPQDEGDKFVSRVNMVDVASGEKQVYHIEYGEPDGLAYAWYHGPTAGVASIEGVPDPGE